MELRLFQFFYLLGFGKYGFFFNIQRCFSKGIGFIFLYLFFSVRLWFLLKGRYMEEDLEIQVFELGIFGMNFGVIFLIVVFVYVILFFWFLQVYVLKVYSNIDFRVIVRIK